MENKKSIGIIIAAIFSILCGVSLLPSMGLILLMAIPMLISTKTPSAQEYTAYEFFSKLFILIAAIIPVCLILSGKGLLSRKKWSRSFSIITASIVSVVTFSHAIIILVFTNTADKSKNLALAIRQLVELWFFAFEHNGVSITENTTFAIWEIIIGSIFMFIIYYLTRPKIKELFR